MQSDPVPGFTRQRLIDFAVCFALWYLCVRLLFGWMLPHADGLPRWAFYLGCTGVFFSAGRAFQALALRFSRTIGFPPFARREAQRRIQALVTFPLATVLVIWAVLENQQQAMGAAQTANLPVLYVPSTIAPDGFTRLMLSARWSDGRLHYTLHSSCGNSRCFPNEVLRIRFQDREGQTLGRANVVIPKDTYSSSVPMDRRDFLALASWTPSIRNAWVRSEAVCGDGVTVSSTRDDACAKHGGVSRWRTLADEYENTFVP